MRLLKKVAVLGTGQSKICSNPGYVVLPKAEYFIGQTLDILTAWGLKPAPKNASSKTDEVLSSWGVKHITDRVANDKYQLWYLPKNLFLKTNPKNINIRHIENRKGQIIAYVFRPHEESAKQPFVKAVPLFRIESRHDRVNKYICAVVCFGDTVIISSGRVKYSNTSGYVSTLLQQRFVCTRELADYGFTDYLNPSSYWGRSFPTNVNDRRRPIPADLAKPYIYYWDQRVEVAADNRLYFYNFITEKCVQFRGKKIAGLCDIDHKVAFTTNGSIPNDKSTWLYKYCIEPLPYVVPIAIIMDGSGHFESEAKSIKEACEFTDAPWIVVARLIKKIDPEAYKRIFHNGDFSKEEER